MLLLLDGIAFVVGGAFELLEKGICAFELNVDEDDPLGLLDFFCLLLLLPLPPPPPPPPLDRFGVAKGSIVGRLEREDECDNSLSFSGDDGESLECVSCEMGLYGGIGFTLPPFFLNIK